MTVEQIIALTTLTATFFGGLIAVLRYALQLAKLIKAHGELVVKLAAQLEKQNKDSKETCP